MDGAAYVQECTPEDRDAKQEVFAALARLAADDCVIASSSSFIPVSQLASNLPGRDRFLVVPRQSAIPRHCRDLPGPVHQPKAIADSSSHARLRPSLVRVRVEKDGFTSTAAGAPLRGAYALIEDGAATVADIDLVIRDGLGLRQSVVGPFEALTQYPRRHCRPARRTLPAYVRIKERGERRN